MDFRMAGIVNDSITDGPGLRLSVFAQGCPHNCPGCHNQHTHDMDGGTWETTANILQKARNNPLLDGVTLTGGDPFIQPEAMSEIASGAHALGLNVIAYTGFTWETLVQNERHLALLRHCDYVIDGRFEEALRSLELEFKGSSNQRLIGVAKSLAVGFAVVYENFEAARADNR